MGRQAVAVCRAGMRAPPLPAAQRVDVLCPSFSSNPAMLPKTNSCRYICLQAFRRLKFTGALHVLRCALRTLRILARGLHDLGAAAARCRPPRLSAQGTPALACSHNPAPGPCCTAARREILAVLLFEPDHRGGAAPHPAHRWHRLGGPVCRLERRRLGLARLRRHRGVW